MGWRYCNLIEVPSHACTVYGSSARALDDKVEEAGVDVDLQFDIDFVQKTHVLRNRLKVVINAESKTLSRRRRHYSYCTRRPPREC
jgi:hypothetical protein